MIIRMTFKQILLIKNANVNANHNLCNDILIIINCVMDFIITGIASYENKTAN